MSGAICQNCSNPYLEQSDDVSLGEWPVECPLCGWKGDASKLPRKMCTPEHYQRFREKLELKKQGKFFLVTIVVDAKDEERFSATSKIMDILKIHSLSSQTREGYTYIQLERSTPIDDDTVSKLKQVKGVKEVLTR